ncbi:MAG: NAD-dependent epimerase/dehydratase family protein [Syntrophales bacterium]|nr:NAD-dependent epimerase/dehydratase family protein [Syntrophales bacterium]
MERGKSMKRVIVTGATGFVGANLTRRLVEDGHEIHLLVRRGCNSWRIKDIYSKVSLHETDLTDGDALAGVVSEIKPEWIFHLAVYGAYSWQKDLHQMVQTNIVGTINLVETCLKTGFESFVNTGTSSEYGYKDYPPEESASLEPNSHYAVTKASATMFCRYMGQSRGMHMPTLRLYSVYGPFEDPGRLIPTLVMEGLAGKLPPLVNPGVMHDFVFIEDVVEAYLLAARKAGQGSGIVYNVGTGIQTSIGEIVASARRIMKIAVEPRWGSMPDRKWDTGSWVADSQRIRKELGWRPEYTLEQGLRRVVEWFKSDSTFRNIYQQKNNP